MRKIIFNGEALVDSGTFGINRYEFEILRRLDSNDNFLKKNEVFVVYPQNKECNLKFKNIKVVPINSKKNGFLGKLIWQQFWLPWYVKKQKGIGVDMTLAMPIWGFKIISMHDCICEEYSENYRNLKERITRVYHFFRTRIITKKNIIILTLSEFSKSEICKFYGKKTNSKIRIVGCGWEHMLDTAYDDTIFENNQQIKKGNYFFSLGSKYKHKNFRWIIDAAKNNKELQFVVTGSNKYNSYYKELEQDCPENLVFTGYVSNEQVKTLMKNCIALIQPSIYEGFGLPPLEALSLNIPIIVSNESCLPEIYKNTAHYINRNYDGCDFSLLLKESVHDSSNVLNEYSWINATQSFINIVEKM